MSKWGKKCYLLPKSASLSYPNPSSYPSSPHRSTPPFSFFYFKTARQKRSSHLYPSACCWRCQKNNPHLSSSLAHSYSSVLSKWPRLKLSLINDYRPSNSCLQWSLLSHSCLSLKRPLSFLTPSQSRILDFLGMNLSRPLCQSKTSLFSICDPTLCASRLRTFIDFFYVYP